MIVRGDASSGAHFSDDEQYRWALWRAWDHSLPRCVWLMLNPSTADETKNDATIRRCIGFARRWGCGSIDVANIFALRARNPLRLREHADPIGPENDEAISSLVLGAQLVVCAWGNHGSLYQRSTHVRELLDDLCEPYCLGTTSIGEPRHPLYVASAVERVPFG